MSVKITSISLTREEILRTVKYDPETGVFSNNIEIPGVCYRGEVRTISMRKANSKSQPQPAIKVNGFYRRATHVAYILMTGQAVPLDHGIFFKDGNRENLCWSNLVLANQSCGGVLPK